MGVERRLLAPGHLPGAWAVKVIDSTPCGMATVTMTAEEWRAEAIRRFGPDRMKWRFVCPSCKHEASIADWKAAGAKEGHVAFSCVGRNQGVGDGDAAKVAAAAFKGKGGPCNYAGGGLFALNPVEVNTGPDTKPVRLFAFADARLNPNHPLLPPFNLLETTDA